MKNDANHIGHSLQKYVSKYNLEQMQPIARMRPIYFFFSKLSLKTGPAAYSPQHPMVQKIWYKVEIASVECAGQV
jgi:hypothetical protein